MNEYKRRFMGMEITASASPSAPGGVRVVAKTFLKPFVVDLPKDDAQWIADVLAALGTRAK